MIAMTTSQSLVGQSSTKPTRKPGVPSGALGLIFLLGALLCALTATPAAAAQSNHPLTAATASDEAWQVALSPTLILPLNVSNITVSEGYPYAYGHQCRRVDAYYTDDTTNQQVATARIVIHRTRHGDRLYWYWLVTP